MRMFFWLIKHTNILADVNPHHANSIPLIAIKHGALLRSSDRYIFTFLRLLPSSFSGVAAHTSVRVNQRHPGELKLPTASGFD